MKPTKANLPYIGVQRIVKYVQEENKEKEESEGRKKGEEEDKEEQELGERESERVRDRGNSSRRKREGQTQYAFVCASNLRPSVFLVNFLHFYIPVFLFFFFQSFLQFL